ncbi:MAG: glycosyltransferase [Halobacteriovoraceae bacterium]|nr:glycosyltransferase [Halobacteriovoraceae bacterium]
MKASFIIPSFKSKRTLDSCLKALEASISYAGLAESESYEIIVQEDPEGRGPSFARNLGATKAKGEYLIFIDADVVLHQEHVKQTIEFLDAHPEYSAVTSTYDHSDLDKGFLSTYKNLYMNFHLKAKGDDVSFLLGAFMGIRKEKFLNFDESVRFGEDTELAQRMLEKGERIFLLKDIFLTHLKQYTAKSFFKNNFQIPFHFCRSYYQKKGEKLNFSHASTRQLASIAISGLMVLSVMGIGAPISLLLLLFWVLNREYYLFLGKRMGVPFFLKAIPLHIIDCVVMGSGIFSGLIYFAFIQLKKRRIRLRTLR